MCNHITISVPISIVFRFSVSNLTNSIADCHFNRFKDDWSLIWRFPICQICIILLTYVRWRKLSCGRSSYINWISCENKSKSILKIRTNIVLWRLWIEVDRLFWTIPWAAVIFSSDLAVHYGPCLGLSPSHSLSSKSFTIYLIVNFVDSMISRIYLTSSRWLILIKSFND